MNRTIVIVSQSPHATRDCPHTVTVPSASACFLFESRICEQNHRRRQSVITRDEGLSTYRHGAIRVHLRFVRVANFFACNLSVQRKYPALEGWRGLLTSRFLTRTSSISVSRILWLGAFAFNVSTPHSGGWSRSLT